MMRSVSIAIVLMVLLLAFGGVSESAFSQGRPFGGLAGLVLDEAGNPIIGAIVRLFPADAPTQPAKALRTDMEGRYIVKKLAPGVYRVRAEARGFLPVAQVVEIKPHVLLTFDFELRRTETLVQRRSDRDDYRWTVRASRRPVLRFNKNGEADQRLIARSSEGRPSGRMTLTSGLVHRRLSGGTMTLALAQEIGPGLQWAVAAQANGRGEYPGRWEMGLFAEPFATHHLATMIAATEWRTDSEAPQALKARRLEFRIADRWHVLPELVLIGGVDVRRTSVQDRVLWRAAPRFGARWAVTDRVRITTNLLSVTAHDAQTDLTREGPTLPALYPTRPVVRSDGRLGDEGRHWDLGFERALGESQAIEIAVFQSATPSRDGAPSMIRAARDDGESRHGVRILYTRSVGEAVRATVGYAFGQRRPSPVEGVGAIAHGDFHLLAGRVDATLARTRTRVVAHFRAGRGWTAADSDPFYNVSPDVLSLLIAPLWEKPTEEGIPSLPLLDPGVTVVIAQELPTSAFLPGRWEAIIEARNLIAGSYTACSDGNALALVRAPRLVRGSLAVRF